MQTAQSPLDLHGVSTIEMVLVVIPIKGFEVQDVRPVKGKYHMNATAIWESISGRAEELLLKHENVGIRAPISSISSSPIHS
jgi:hypothetical protein